MVCSTYTKMYIVTMKTCEAPGYVCSFYRPPHQLTGVADTHTEHNQCHMYISTVVPADAPCYVTHYYRCTPDGLYLAGDLCYFSILSKLFIMSEQGKKICFITQNYDSKNIYSEKTDPSCY